MPPSDQERPDEPEEQLPSPGASSDDPPDDDRLDDDHLDEQEEESFPASDPHSDWAGRDSR